MKKATIELEQDYLLLYQAEEKIGQTVVFVNEEMAKADRVAEETRIQIETIEHAIYDSSV